MLSHQKNNLLSLLAELKSALYKYNNEQPNPNAIIFIIENNLTSIEKQIKKL